MAPTSPPALRVASSDPAPAGPVAGELGAATAWNSDRESSKCYRRVCTSRAFGAGCSFGGDCSSNARWRRRAFVDTFAVGGRGPSMVSVRDLQRLARTLTQGEKTTRELATAVGWSIADAKARLTNLAAEGAVVKVKRPRDATDKRRRWQNGSLPTVSRAELSRLARAADGEEKPSADERSAPREPRTAAIPAFSGPIDPSNPYAPPRSDFEPVERIEPSKESGGNFVLGLLAGLLGGLLILVFVLRSGKPETKRGMYWGIGIQISLYILSIMVGGR